MTETQLSNTDMNSTIKPTFSKAGNSLKFEVLKKCSRSKARAANMTLPHGTVRLLIIQ